MLDSGTQKRNRGFSLIELLIAIAMMMVLAAITVPRALSTISDLRVRYTATNLNGLLQTARMQSIRKNTYYTVQPTTLPTGDAAYYVHLQAGTYTFGDNVLPIGSQVAVSLGSGSGAPNESSFLSGFGFTTHPGTDYPSFNARGLPCLASGGACPKSDLGFVFFVRNASVSGDTTWASVVITPSGRVQLWTCDGGSNWVQRN
jgi:prepilin-type N-terminal cleavage/methylation domain-containing protein